MCFCVVDGREGDAAHEEHAACPRVYIVPRPRERGEAGARHLQSDRAPLDTQGPGDGV